MTSDLLTLEVIDHHVRLTHLKDGIPVHLYLEPLNPVISYGDVYSGRVVSHDYSRAWIDIGWTKPGLLNLKSRSLNDGEPVFVTVKREPVREFYRLKPPLLKFCDPKTLKEIPKEALQTVPRLLKRGAPPWIDYLQTLPSNTAVLVTDLPLFTDLKERLSSLTWRLQTTGPLPREVQEAWDETLSPALPLKGGGVVVIEEGDTLTAVDVNTTSLDGTPTPLRNEHDLVCFLREASQEIAKFLILRQVGGMVIIDFPRLKNKEHQSAFSAHLKELFLKSRATPLGFTRGGLYELILEQNRPSLLQKSKDRNPMS